MTVVAPALTPDTVMVPSAAPWQDTFVDDALTVTAIGCVMVTDVLCVHAPALPLPSAADAVTTYVPGANVL